MPLDEIDPNTMKKRAELNKMRIIRIFEKKGWPRSYALLLRNDILIHGAPSIFTEADVVIRINREISRQRISQVLS